MGEFEDRWAEFETEVGPTLVDAMAEEAPRDTGFLADESQSWQDTDGRLEIVSTDDRGPVAKWQIRGTRDHGPVTAPYLVFQASDGGWVTTSWVRGVTPNPYNQRAWENVRDEVVSEFKERVGRQYVLSLLNPWKNRQL